MVYHLGKLWRSKGGFFYEEFISERFVGLAWNYIEKNTSFEKNNIEQLKAVSYTHLTLPTIGG